MTDPQQIQTELERAAEAREEHVQLTRRIDGARPHLEGLVERVAELRRKLESEAADVERLETLSAARIWSRLKGSQADDLERETAEREAARYAVAEAEARLEVMQRELDSLVSRRAELGDVTARYDQALAAKQAWLEGTGGPEAVELADIAQRRGELLAVDKEMREAHAAGTAARSRLARALDVLGSAGSWSTWDAFGGGGLMTDMIKYQKVDEATALVRQADQALAAFSRELADVDLPQVTGVQVDQMMRTFDVWFDNIFSDMAVRSRIDDARNRVGAALQQVDQALAALAQKGRGVESELARLQSRREQLLLG